MVGVLMRTLRSPRRRAAVIGAVLLGVLATSCGSSDPDRSSTGAVPSATDQSAQGANGPKETITVGVAPVGPDGTLDDAFSVIATKDQASCPRPSGLVFSAFSCSAGDLLFDPCWAEAGAGPSVICMPQPWSDEVYRLELEQPISVEALEGVDESPWGIELQSGLRCRLATGAHDTVGEEVVDYFCGDDEALVLLRGSIDRSSPYWTAEAAERVGDGYERVEDQTITTVWFGS